MLLPFLLAFSYEPLKFSVCSLTPVILSQILLYSLAFVSYTLINLIMPWKNGRWPFVLSCNCCPLKRLILISPVVCDIFVLSAFSKRSQLFFHVFSVVLRYFAESFFAPLSFIHGPDFVGKFHSVA